MEDLYKLQKRSAKDALQPFLWCTIPGMVLVALASWLRIGWLQWPGWAMLIFACVWAGVRWYKADRKAKEALAELRQWQREHGL